MRKLMFCLAVVLSSAASLAAAGCPSGVPTGCDPSVMSEAYWKIWNEAEQAKIDADIEANRKTEGSFRIPAPVGTDVRYEQIDHDFHPRHEEEARL